jgi:hypothetical protein
VGEQHVALLQYDADIFCRLNQFHDAKELLAEHESSITRLGDVICDYNLERHVGVNLLHKHFEISGDELVLREFIGNVAYMKPAKVGECQDVIPYLWKLGTGRFGEGYYPLEFVQYASSNDRAFACAEVEKVSQSHEFLADMASKLKELGLQDLFGIASLHSRIAFLLKEDETLLETTDETNRVLTLEPATMLRVKALDTTKTLWFFNSRCKDDPLSLSIGSNCVSHCISHCHGHYVLHSQSEVK